MPIIPIAQNQEEAIARAIHALRQRECVIVPTETVYGIAADATKGNAVAQIFEFKGRPRFNPLICHVCNLGMARRFGQLGDTGARLAERFWPGPLTLVAPAITGAVHDLVTAGLETIALRQPKGIAGEIIARLGSPLAIPSANRSGRISPVTAAQAAAEFPEHDLVVLDGGRCPVGLESTIVKLAEGDRLVLLRPGAVTARQLREATGLPVIAAEAGRIEAPGMMERHYAPDAPILLDIRDCPQGAALLAFGSDAGKNRQGASAILNLSENCDLREAAANLYHYLRQLDGKHPALIVVEPIPQEGLGMAINDRLRRAAAPKENV